jgi:hypothetical protein
LGGGELTQRWMNEKSRLEHVNCMFVGPFYQAIIVYALVSSRSGFGLPAIIPPFVSDHSYITMTHGSGPKLVQAMLFEGISNRRVSWTAWRRTRMKPVLFTLSVGKVWKVVFLVNMCVKPFLVILSQLIHESRNIKTDHTVYLMINI